MEPRRSSAGVAECRRARRAARLPGGARRGSLSPIGSRRRRAARARQPPAPPAVLRRSPARHSYTAWEIEAMVDERAPPPDVVAFHAVRIATTYGRRSGG